MAIATVAKSGQITVPKEILDFLKIQEMLLTSSLTQRTG
ncbi:MAG: AbrB/MazE/SpoVT family DNA-binding domain-containing protein [Oscillatoria sp. SIO1A7]|nr:AbrB/MazE/SpoVT family DNA-binding domain-containing protein [Oscillatoria sp. SIO1A7]